MPSERERGRKEDDRYRLVVPKHAQTKELLSNDHSKHNRNNAIKTTKYSVWSFLPKNLFEQFHRFANIYFLGIVILNLIPEINAFGKYIAMVPLIFVLSVTAGATTEYRAIFYVFYLKRLGGSPVALISV